MTDDEIREMAKAQSEALVFAFDNMATEIMLLRKNLNGGLGLLAQAIEKAVEDLNRKPLKIQIEELRDPRRFSATLRADRSSVNPGQGEMFHGEHSPDLPAPLGHVENARVDGEGVKADLVIDGEVGEILLARRKKIVRKRPGDPIRHGVRWTEEEVRRIIILAHEGKSVGQIARLHRRKESGIKSEFKRHGYQIRGGYVLGVRADDLIREELIK